MSRYVNGTGGGLQNTSYGASASSGSIALWLQPQWNSGDSTTRVFMTFSNDGTHDAPTFQRFSDNNIYCGFAGFAAGEQRIIIADTGHFTLGTWVHWVYTWVNGGNSYLYKNGVQVGTRAAITANGQAGKVTLFNTEDFLDPSPSNFYLAEVGYWNAALTADEAGYLGQGGHVANVRTSSLVSYWPLKGTANPEPDVAGGFSLTFTGSVSAGVDPPVVDRTPAPEQTYGPTQRGAPWGQKVIADKAYGAVTAAPPPTTTAANTFAREVTTGPPLRGAPWAQRLFVEPRITPPPVAAPAPPATPNSYAREVTTGPPLRGAPFAQRLFVEPVPYRSPPGPAPTPPRPIAAKGLPFLERVPDVEGPGGADRLRRHTEKLSNIINSLVAQGILVQIGPAKWTIDATKLTNADNDVGLTGVYSSPGDYHV